MLFIIIDKVITEIFLWSDYANSNWLRVCLIKMIFGIIIKQHQNTPSVKGNIGASADCVKADSHWSPLTIWPSQIVWRLTANGHHTPSDHLSSALWWSLTNDFPATLNAVKDPFDVWTRAGQGSHVKINNFINLLTDWILHNWEDNEENDYFHNCRPNITIINKQNSLLLTVDVFWCSTARYKT